jgi:ADP-heptose:LPS heptosyltransferase
MLPTILDPGVRRVAYVRARVGLGDLLCTVPAWRALRAARPDLRISVVTWAETAPVLARFAAYVDELLPFRGYPGIPERPADPRRLDGFLRAAAIRRFDLVIQGYGDRPAANRVCDRIDAPRRGGFAAAGYRPDTPAWYLPYPRRVHEVHRHLRLVEHLGVPAGADDALEFPACERDRRGFAALARAHDLAPGTYAVLHPGATSASRRWPPDRFAAVADALAGRGLRVIVTGVAGEEAVTAAVRRHARGDVLDLTARTTLGEFACLLNHAAVLVANDTGAAHLAAAVGTPSVTIFLAGDPVRWAYDDPRHPAVRATAPCSPCPHLTCPIDFRCAHSVTAQDVVSAAAGLLR